jgi:peptidylprolyl isomerase domain and WD repeat-containing protein 1
MSDSEDRKRNAESDDEDVGPQIPTADTSKPHTKKLKTHNVILYLKNLPSADMYEKSLMHRDVCNFVCVAPSTDFVITTSIDGHVKFWKKPSGKTTQPSWAGDLGVLEFVKHFKAHLGAIVGLDISFDGTLAATISVDKTLKVFDVVNFDMINMFKLDFLPKSVAWCHQSDLAQALLLVSDRETSNIYVYDAKASDAAPLYTVEMHKDPVHLLKYNSIHNVVISLDQSGTVEYWVPEKDGESFGRKPNVEEGVFWDMKSETDLFEFRKVYFFSFFVGLTWVF